LAAYPLLLLLLLLLLEQPCAPPYLALPTVTNLSMPSTTHFPSCPRVSLSLLEGPDLDGQSAYFE